MLKILRVHQTRHRKQTLRRGGSAVVVIALALGGLLVPSLAHADAPVTVADAIATQSGSATVRGYVVGQPISSSTVVTSDFPNDYALALADSADEADTAQMLYVQVPSAFRAEWGLQSNTELVGQQIDVTGGLTAYFSHPGLKSATAFAFAGGDPGDPDPGDPDPGDPDPGDPDPGDPGLPGDYYNGTDGLTGQELQDKLHGIISTGVTTLNYDEVWDALKDTDEDPNNSGNVVELYTGKSTPKNNNGGDVDNWNREHVWAKSHGDFGTANGPGTDVHHLRPTDVTVNSSRGNKDFDLGGTPHDEAPGNFADSDSWEPRDAVKGDVARMIFYMSVRWEGEDGKPDLEVNDQVNNGSNPNHGKLSVLLQWNEQDPPDAFEKSRNEKIYSDWQHNRNPFIDNPAWANAIWG